MKCAAVSKLKASLSEYIDMVKRGEEVLVTERGKPVARLVPPGVQDDDARRLDLIKRGIIRPGRPGGISPELISDLPLANVPRDVILRIMDEEREDRA